MTQDVVLKKYAHRRLYDIGRRKFMTLAEIAELVKAGATVSARDGFDRDITTDVLSQIILKQEAEGAACASPLSSEVLRKLIVLAQPATHGVLPMYLEQLARLLEFVPTASHDPRQQRADGERGDGEPSSIDEQTAEDIERSYAASLVSPLRR